MKATIKEVNSVQKRIQIELDQEEVKGVFTSHFNKVRKKANIKGFRPGKVPLHLVKKFYGEMIALDVANELVKKNLFDAIEEHKINPIAAPVIETSEAPEEGKGYTFSALVDIMPPVTIEGYKGLKLNYKKMDINDETVDMEMKYLQRRQAKTQPLSDSDASEKGHLITFSQNAVDEEGNPVKGLTSENIPVELGEQSHLLADIEKELYGLKKGDEKKFSVNLPKDYRDKDLAGKKVDLEIKVNNLELLELPELNDEFAKELGQESLDQLKSNVEKSIKQQADNVKRGQLEGQLFKALEEKNTFDIPPALVDQVTDGIISEMQWPTEKDRKAALSNQEMRKNYRQNAQTRAKNSIILSEIIKAEKIELADEDIDNYINQLMSQNGAQNVDQKIIDSFKKNIDANTKENLLYKKAIDFILDNSEITEE